MDWKHLGFIDQAKELDYRVGQALRAMRAEDNTGDKPRESEVSFRLDSIIWILTICKNDISDMVKEWEHE